jgi:hypothetical protein
MRDFPAWFVVALALVCVGDCLGIEGKRGFRSVVVWGEKVKVGVPVKAG